MALEFFNSVAILSIIAEKLEDHIFEISWETGTIDFFEVGFDLTGQKKVVEVFFFSGFLEWENALYDNEYNDTNAEQVNLSAVVGLSFFDLRCHVGHCASVGL